MATDDGHGYATAHPSAPADGPAGSRVSGSSTSRSSSSTSTATTRRRCGRSPSASGVTKAALYYHFERKEDILLELHLRLHALGWRPSISSTGSTATSRSSPPGLGFSTLIDEVLATATSSAPPAQRARAHQMLHNERHRAENEDLEQRSALPRQPAIPLADRVRMTCSIGAVMAVIGGQGGVFGDVPPDRLAEVVRDAVRDLLVPDDRLQTAPGRGTQTGCSVDRAASPPLPQAQARARRSSNSSQPA